MKSFAITMLLFFAIQENTQAQSFRSLDKSPMDVAYLPDNFAHDREDGQKALMKVVYSQPQKKGRKVFGGLVNYDKVWRTGANEATEIKIFQDLMIGGKKVKAGTYSLFTIPTTKDWTIILNSDLDYWGAYSYKESNDVLRVQAPSKESSNEVEAFSIRLEDLGNNKAVMRLAWDTTIVEIPITY